MQKEYEDHERNFSEITIGVSPAQKPMASRRLLEFVPECNKPAGKGLCVQHTAAHTSVPLGRCLPA